MRGRFLPMVALVATAFGGSCRDEAEPEAQDRLGKMRARQEGLWKAFEAAVSRDPLLAEATADRGEVVVALNGSFLQRSVRDVASRYLERVELDLPLEATVEKAGELTVKKIVSFKAGTWKASLAIHRIRGVLSARPPEVSLPEGDRVGLTLPVTLQKGSGTATVRFAWDSEGAANAVCRDFQVSREIEGRVLPETYTFKGELRLAVAENAFVLRPSFPDARVRLKIDLTPESWARVRSALQEQDSFFRCGIALRPQDVEEKLRSLVAKGFEVRLPRSLFRTIRLQASLRQAVEVQGRSFDLSVKPSALRTAEGALWSTARVELKRESR